MKRRNLVSASALLVLAATALAQDADPAPVSNPADYRWAIFTSCSVAFAAIIVYLVVTHNRAASVANDVAALERRLDELEGTSKK
ncbi:MAG: hypothetical protein K8T90_10805 [Planctomycetes bacterium]|nr:hypothetical protein [Planctomycetota bacterium]